MTEIYVGDLGRYRAIKDLYDAWSTDISSQDCFKTFEEYWNRRIDSPKMCCIPEVARIKVKLSAEASFYVPLQLTFESDEERTFWLLQNT